MRQVKEKKFIVPPKVPVPSNSCSNEGTAAGSNIFFVCFRTVFTEEEADENGWVAVILRACNIIV